MELLAQNFFSCEPIKQPFRTTSLLDSAQGGSHATKMEITPSMEDRRTRHLTSGISIASHAVPAIKLVGLALLIALGIRAFLVQPYVIPSGSMSPLLNPGDFIIVDKKAYGWNRASLPLNRFGDTDPAAMMRIDGKPIVAGDVVVFTGPRTGNYVKRVVATSGERVAMRDGRLILNGRMVDCLESANGMCKEQLPNGRSYNVITSAAGELANFTEIVVPEGHYFMLGDNRDASADSRLSRQEGGVGLVSDGQVIGRADHIFYSARKGVRWTQIGAPL